MKRFQAVALGVVLASWACSTGDDSQPDSAASAPGTVAQSSGSANEALADAGRYRLTMDKIDKYYAAQRNILLKMKSMTPAEREQVDLDMGEKSIDGWAASLERHGPVNAALRDAGLSAKEYATITVAMIQSSMAAGVLQMRPNDNQDSLAREMKVSMENVRFVRQNEAELARKQQAFAAEIKRLGFDEESDSGEEEQDNDP